MHKPTDSFCPNQRARSGSCQTLPSAYPSEQRGPSDLVEGSGNSPPASLYWKTVYSLVGEGRDMSGENKDVDPSQESEIEDLATPGIISTTIAAGLGVIIAILLAIYLFLTPAIWFFCSAAEGQSCGVEVVFWPISFF